MTKFTQTNQGIMYKALRNIIAIVWLVNGLYCKVLNGVPRHEEIVAAIVSEKHAAVITIGIGLAEILMAVWVWLGIKTKLATWVQIVAVVTMNVIEFLLVPDLLLWGQLNLVFAILFAGIVYYYGCILHEKVKANNVK